MSLNRTPPKRLKENNQGLEQLSKRSFSPERLKANREQLEEKIQASTVPTSSLTKNIVIGLGTIAVVTATAVWLNITPGQHPTLSKDQERSEQVKPSPVEASEAPNSPTLREVTPEALSGDNPENVNNKQNLNRQKPSEEEGKFKSLDKAPLRTVPTQTRKPKKQPPDAPKPDLAAEIKSYQKAKTYFENQNLEEAHKTLKQLRQNFDNPKLQVEVDVLLAQTLLGLEQPDQALTVLKNIMETSNTKPQAQWYKLLGDIQKSRNQCGPALIAYSKAIKKGLSQEQLKQVRASVRACSQNQ